ncbi:3811_t:CDS:2 [Scutellospora calospora]|uniref:3811_t:CDS:1 n=1 Tax=Scutellospora calospora TaxID=85575 RepID=A0ACA9LES3_9GLOM|nr:3811_t:CDS:2 [Scutellospora calospora]
MTYKWNKKWDKDLRLIKKQNSNKNEFNDEFQYTKNKSKYNDNKDDDSNNNEYIRKSNEEYSKSLKKLNKNKINDIVDMALKYCIKKFNIKDKERKNYMKNKFENYITEINDNFDNIETFEFENEIEDDLDSKFILIFKKRK